jgi:hypothetical protein
MTGALAREVRNIQNPALGGALLWRFACAYRAEHRTAEHVAFPLLFVVLPILFHRPTCEFVRRTRRASGLRAVAAKFSDSAHSKSDLLLAIHSRAEQLRPLTLESFRVAQLGRLLHLDTSGHVVCLTETAKVFGDAEVRALVSDAERLGGWFSELTLHEIAIALKVRF